MAHFLQQMWVFRKTGIKGVTPWATGADAKAAALAWVALSDAACGEPSTEVNDSQFFPGEAFACAIDWRIVDGVVQCAAPAGAVQEDTDVEWTTPPPDETSSEYDAAFATAPPVVQGPPAVPVSAPPAPADESAKPKPDKRPKPGKS